MKRLISLLVMLTMIFTILPAARIFAVGTQDAHPTPEGYNDHDYQKLVTFLETVDGNGMTNGEKINRDYDPDDPATWSRVEMDGTLVGPTWTEGEDKKLVAFFYQAAYGDGYGYGYGYMRGDLDLSGCTELTTLECYENELSSINVSNCPKLTLFNCDNNVNAFVDFEGCPALEFLCVSATGITELDVSELPMLKYLFCDFLQLTELDLSGNPALKELVCSYNQLTELDLSGHDDLEFVDCSLNSLTKLDLDGCTALRTIICDVNQLPSLDVSCCSGLRTLMCSSNPITELDLTNNPQLYNIDTRAALLTDLDLSNNPLIPFDRIIAAGNGYIGLYLDQEEDTLFIAMAAAQNGAKFNGWYDEAGELITQSIYLIADGDSYGEVTARFTGAEVIPGDANGDGAVDSSDALLLLRYAMGLISIDPQFLEACDMNGDGSVSADDALIVLRSVMGV